MTALGRPLPARLAPPPNGQVRPSLAVFERLPASVALLAVREHVSESEPVVLAGLGARDLALIKLAHQRRAGDAEDLRGLADGQQRFGGHHADRGTGGEGPNRFGEHVGESFRQLK